MDLIERYVAAVGRQLPPKQATDIEGELREELLSRKEEREAALGRAFTRQDVEALLLEFGHPLVVAARYRETQQLIGPEVFPFWLTTIRWSLIILAVVDVTLLTMAVLLGRPAIDIGRIHMQMLSIAWALFGSITVAFSAFERVGKTAFLRRWKPSRLPPVGKRRSAFALSAEIAMNLVFLAWWFGYLKFRDYVPAPSFLTIALAPVWVAWRWPIALYSVLEIAANGLAIARPAWMRFNRALTIARTLFGVFILSQVLRAGHWIEVGGLPPQALAEAQKNFDLAMRAGIGLTIVGLGVRIGLEAWRLYRGREAPSGGQPCAA